MIGVATSSDGSSGPRDRRAWDAVIEGQGWRIGVEAETRLHDVQSLLRRVALKQRDGAVSAVILLVNDTANNRRVLGSSGSSSGPSSPCPRATVSVD